MPDSLHILRSLQWSTGKFNNLFKIENVGLEQTKTNSNKIFVILIIYYLDALYFLSVSSVRGHLYIKKSISYFIHSI